MPGELGPLQDIWNAWLEVENEMERKPISHFERAAQIQFDELRGHLEAGDDQAAAREMADVISIARDRAETGMSGQARQILAKYEQIHHIQSPSLHTRPTQPTPENPRTSGRRSHHP
ncbi:hypothetical protein PV682_28475 [Streptomyces niveiscabiei]|uniref:hypothetical protein n=1 Tax=Streptomyces niveiscabiei TaxID=164115 RepID=UPI0029B16816|nr:hypothetical protein [Streptomyces niveiscabiei]MDX3385378.1 hypothetical protein [Streptomyces niveiscabiei]